MLLHVVKDLSYYSVSHCTDLERRRARVWLYRDEYSDGTNITFLDCCLIMDRCPKTTRKQIERYVSAVLEERAQTT